MHVVCPKCAAINRVPAEKLGAGGKCGKCSAALFPRSPIALDDATFSTHIARSDIPVVVDFWAGWCGPCRAMAPAFEQAAAKLEPRVRLAKVDTESAPRIASEYGIRSIPTLVLFKGGRESARVSGALDLPRLVGWVNEHV